MKIILTLVLAVCFVPLAGAQNGTKPGQQPQADTPARITPEETPAQPSQIPPAQPSTDKPAMPSTDQPAQGGVITKQATSTPEVLAVPEDKFFRPFTPAAIVQIAAPARAGEVAAKPVRTNVDPVLALKRQQVLELKALRRRLKTRPNAEIEKAVAVMEADHKAAITALEAANKAYAEKDQKVRSKPVKKANKVMLAP